MDRETVNKLQHQYWVTKQTVYRKLGKKEDECIIASDSELDSKLELFKSIQRSSSAMNKLLDRFQDKICVLAQEQNEMGRFLKEYGKTDKSPAGKMMIQMGKSLIYSSQQEIILRPPLLRLYQEVDTFRFRAVDDTLGTLRQMEKLRTEYRASLNWMKKVSQELDPDTNKQMEKFRKVQNHVKTSKSHFDKLKLASLQKVDLLAAARCNMFSHALIQYLAAMSKITSKNSKIFNTLAVTFNGYQYFEFKYIKELAEPSEKLAQECGNKEATEELLFDFNDELGGGGGDGGVGGKDGAAAAAAAGAGVPPKKMGMPSDDLLSLSNTASAELDTLLGPFDLSPETETAQDALDLGPPLPPLLPFGSATALGDGSSLISGGGGGGVSAIQKKPEGGCKEMGKGDDVSSLLASEEFEGLSFEQESGDTLALLNEILSAAPTHKTFNQTPLIPSQDGKGGGGGGDAGRFLHGNMQQAQAPSSFMPSFLLDLGALGKPQDECDLMSLGGPSALPKPLPLGDKGQSEEKKWYDIFADLDPLGNPDAVGDKEKDASVEKRYC